MKGLIRTYLDRWNTVIKSTDLESHSQAPQFVSAPSEASVMTTLKMKLKEDEVTEQSPGSYEVLHTYMISVHYDTFTYINSMLLHVKLNSFMGIAVMICMEMCPHGLST